MQRTLVTKLEPHFSQFYLPELLEDERKHLTRNRLTVSQRFQLCIQAINAMQEIIRRGDTVECLGLHGVIVTLDGQRSVTKDMAQNGRVVKVEMHGEDTLNVRIGAIYYPTAILARAAAATKELNALFALFNDGKLSKKSYNIQREPLLDAIETVKQLEAITITTTDSSDVNNEKKAVQLLGLMFLEVFRIFWKADPLAERAALMIDGKLPVSNSFKFGLQDFRVDRMNNSYTVGVDDVSEVRLSQLLVNMCQFNAEKRLTLADALQEFMSIQSGLTLVHVEPHFTTASSLEQNIAQMLSAIVKCIYEKRSLAQYVQENQQFINGLLPHLSAHQFQFVNPHISQYLNSPAQTTGLQQAGVLSRESTTDIDATFDAEGGHVRIHRTHTVRFFGNIDPAHPHNRAAAAAATSVAAASLAPPSFKNTRDESPVRLPPTHAGLCADSAGLLRSNPRLHAFAAASSSAAGSIPVSPREIPEIDVSTSPRSALESHSAREAREYLPVVQPSSSQVQSARTAQQPAQPTQSAQPKYRKRR